MNILSDSYDFDNNQNLASSDEVLQPSSLGCYQWPETDPSLVDQPTRLRSAADFNNVLSASTNVSVDWDMFEKNNRGKNITEKVFALLTNSKLQFNTRTKILEEPLWFNRIKKSIDKGEPILITYPLFCKIGNWAKQMTNIGPNAGEEAIILFFRHINRMVKKIYAPGLKFIIVTDAQLYNSAFHNAEVEVTTYINECGDLIKTRSADDFIEFVNYVDLLSEFSTEYMTAHIHYQEVIGKNPSSILAGIHAKTLFDSVKASINTRKFMMDYNDQKEIFSQHVNKKNRHYNTIERMTRSAFEEVICVRLACGELDIFERIYPDNIRVTCHKGFKNGRAVIGLRPYPEYYGSSKLLPYHGVPVLSNTRHGLKLNIEPEVMLRGRLDITRVIDEKGHTYYYDAICNNLN